MEAVGYDLYCKMLNEAVKVEKGIVPEERFETSIDIETDAYIPISYIANEYQKLDIYKRIAGVETQEESEEMTEELIDRFGDPPNAVMNLLRIACLKAQCHKAYIEDITQRGESVKITMYEKAQIDVAKIPELLEKFSGLKFVPDKQKPYFTYQIGVNSRESANDILETLENMTCAFLNLVL